LVDPTGRVRKVTAPDGTTTRTEYAGIWTHIYDAKDNKTSTRSDFLGREVERKLYDGAASTPSMQYDYAYDGLDRLLTATVGGATVTNTWGDLRDAGTPLSNAASYCYDGLGRLLGVDRDPAGAGSPCAPTAEETFEHDARGNLSKKNGTPFGFGTKPHQPTSFGPYASIDYDANGSRTGKDRGAGTKDELVYDARGLLVQVKRWTSGSVTSSQTNLYDYAGNRVVKAPSAGAGTAIRTYSRYADVGGGNLTKYYYFAGRLVGSYVVVAPGHLNAGDRDPELVVPPPRLELQPQLLFPVAGTVLLLLVLPLGRRRTLGVRIGLARSASLSVVLVTASSPVVLLAGCASASLNSPS
jgi:hypothetical protein